MIKEIVSDHSPLLIQVPVEGGELCNKVHVRINAHITADISSVSYTTSNVPEEQACLTLIPADTNYHMQLMFVQHTAQPDIVKIFVLHYHPEFFDQFETELLTSDIHFRFNQRTQQQFSFCSQTRQLLDQLDQQSLIDSPLIQALHYTETAIHIFRRSLQCITQVFAACQAPACRFLASEQEREKIFEAKKIIALNIHQPLTIRELSRKVAMNECYLKKGFKVLTGCTIHEYQQSLRISKAKELLQQQGKTVTEVAAVMGFSSISHFSTAFKRETGIKPCELLA